MHEEQHLLRAHYEDLIRGKTPPRWLLHRMFRHLLERCPTCRVEWQGYCEGPHGEALDFSMVDGPPVEASDEQNATDGVPFPAHHPEEPVISETADEPASAPLSPSTTHAEISDRRLARVFDRVRKMRKRITKDQRNAMDLFDELMGLPDTPSRVQRVRRSTRFRNWALCDLMLSQCHEAGFRDPTFAEELAELAVETAWVLEGSELPGATVADLLARGWGLLANARRLSGQLSLSGETFLMAYFFLEQGTGDPIVMAEVLGYEASLRRDQRQLDLSLRLLKKVDAIYRRAGEEHLQGRTALKIALALRNHGDLSTALSHLERARRLIDPQREPRLELAVRHTEVLLLLESGRGDQARLAFQELQPLYDQFDDHWTQLRRRWLEGKIAAGLDELEDAEAALREAREGFIHQGLGYDTALVSLDLAALLLAQGRTTEVKELAGQMAHLFTALELEEEAMAALITFCEAANAERATVEAARKTLKYLDQLYRRRRRCGSLPS